jgi:hypothetical protein
VAKDGAEPSDWFVVTVLDVQSEHSTEMRYEISKNASMVHREGVDKMEQRRSADFVIFDL